MNLISTMVGLSIMGAATPGVMQMSIAPFEAQKRAQNLGVAESAAVTYAAKNEGADTLSAIPEGCERFEIGAFAYEIECTEGEGTKYKQTVTRAFRLRDQSSDNDGNSNGNENSDTVSFSRDAPAPSEYSHYGCPDGDKTRPGWPVDPWGTAYYNRDHMGGKYCIPSPAVGGLDSDDDMSTWLWDLRPAFGNVFDRA